MDEPNSRVYLINCLLDQNYNHTLTFSNTTDQANYFISKSFRNFSDYTYIRENKTITVYTNIENIEHCNYIMYRNPNYSSKWYYAFVKKLEYVNPDATRIYFEQDCIQTWYFNLTYKKSIIERKHVTNDSIGANTIPEGLETGDYISNGSFTDENLDNILEDTVYVLGSTVDVNSSADILPAVGGGKYNGIYSGVKYYAFSRGAEGGINYIMQKIAEKGQSDALTGLFIVPKVLASNNNTDGGAVLESDNPVTYTVSVPKNYGLGGYTPKNNKVKTYPFTYLLATNNRGVASVLNYEYFSSQNATFRVDGVLCPSGSMYLTPTNYKGDNINTSEGMPLGKFPICNYQTDMYTNWLAQNSVDVFGFKISPEFGGVMDILNSTIQGTISGAKDGAFGGLIGGVAGGIIGGTASLFSSTYNNMKTLKQHELVPPTIQGEISCGDVLTATNRNNFKFYHMSIKSEFAKRIDDYFSIYGYKVDTLEVPQLHTRSNWNFIKTSELNVAGNVSQDVINTIKNAFNKGITFWHNGDTMLDYSQNNTIL